MFSQFHSDIFCLSYYLQIYCCMFRSGLDRESSASCVTWCSRTNQRWAHTTTRRTLPPQAQPGLRDSVVTFVARNLWVISLWSNTWPTRMASVRSSSFRVPCAHECSTTNRTWRGIWNRCMEPSRETDFQITLNKFVTAGKTVDVVTCSKM